MGLSVFSPMFGRCHYPEYKSVYSKYHIQFVIYTVFAIYRRPLVIPEFAEQM
jgi:hypothetical protein